MKNLYHSRGFWNGLLRQPVWHLREFGRNRDYRDLHQFSTNLNNLPRCSSAYVSHNGYEIELCDPASFLSAWDEIFVNRIYEIPLTAGYKPVLVDAGANIGLAALFGKIHYRDFDYLGFEPDPQVAACCRRNLGRWGVGGQLVEAAEGDVRRFAADGADGGHLIDGGQLRVKTTRLSHWLPARVDLLKIDVEGAEAAVLCDIVPQLRAVQHIFVEWHYLSGGGGLGEAIASLEKADFDCHVQVAAGAKRPFMATEPTESSYIQNLNLYALRP